MYAWTRLWVETHFYCCVCEVQTHFYLLCMWGRDSLLFPMYVRQRLTYFAVMKSCRTWLNYSLCYHWIIVTLYYFQSVCVEGYWLQQNHVNFFLWNIAHSFRKSCHFLFGQNILWFENSDKVQRCAFQTEGYFCLFLFLYVSYILTKLLTMPKGGTSNN
jgi:hypothetical protein